MKIGLVAPVKPSHPYLKDGPASLLNLHYLHIPPWLRFRSLAVKSLFGSIRPGNYLTQIKLVHKNASRVTERLPTCRPRRISCERTTLVVLPA